MTGSGQQTAKWPREVSPSLEPQGSSEIPSFPLFTAGLPQHCHLNIEQKDDSRRLEDLGVMQDQHFGYNKSFCSGFLPAFSHPVCIVYPTLPHIHPTFLGKCPFTCQDSVQDLPVLRSFFCTLSSPLPPLEWIMSFCCPTESPCRLLSECFCSGMNCVPRKVMLKS